MASRLQLVLQDEEWFYSMTVPEQGEFLLGLNELVKDDDPDDVVMVEAARYERYVHSEFDS